MIKACIFDLDGTLSDTIADIADSGNYALERNGFLPYPEKDYCYFCGSGVRTLIQRKLEKQPHTPQQFEQVLADYSRQYAAHNMDKTCAYNGIPQLLSFCREHGVACAVVSNKPMADTQAVVSRLFGDGAFQEVYGIKPPIPVKPAPDAVFYVMDKLGVHPEECLYFGDTDVDMQTAKNAGLTAIGALWGFRTYEELQENGADYILEDPRDAIPLIAAENGTKRKEGKE